MSRILSFGVIVCLYVSVMMRLCLPVANIASTCRCSYTSSSAVRHDGIEQALAAFRREGSQHWRSFSRA